MEVPVNLIKIKNKKNFYKRIKFSKRQVLIVKDLFKMSLKFVFLKVVVYFNIQQEEYNTYNTYRVDST